MNISFPSCFVRTGHTNLHKHTATTGTLSGGVAFVHAYHDDPWNAFLHVLSMPVYVHSLIIVPLVFFTHPFLEIESTRNILTAFLLVMYLPFDSWGAIFYSIFVHQVFSWGIYFDLYRSFAYGLMVGLVGGAEIIFTQVIIGHNLFQGYNASFEIREAYKCTPFYFVLRTMRCFGNFFGVKEELSQVPPPHEPPIGEMGEILEPKLVHNWCRNTTSLVSSIMFPSSLKDLVTIVQNARSSGKRIRAIGKGHTFNKMALVDSNNILVRMDWLQEVRVDPFNRRAFVQSGATVEKVDQALAQHGLCVPTNVVLKSVTWGGITQTGSHGSGHVPLCDTVQALTIVDGTGQVRKLRRETNKDKNDLFQAVVQGLGTCGLLYELEISVELIKTLRMTNQVLSSFPTVEQILEAHRSSDQSEIFFICGTEKSIIRRWIPADRKETVVDRAKYLFSSIFCHLMIPLHLPLSQLKCYHKLDFTELISLAGPQNERVGDVHDIIHCFERLQDIPILSSEFVLKVQDLEVAVSDLRELLREYRSKGVASGCFIAEVRVTPRSETLLFAGAGSGASEELVAWLEIIGPTCENFRRFEADLSERIMQRFPYSFPHWAKDLTVIPNEVLRKRAEAVFGDNLTRFNAVRKQLDPEGLFMNEWLSTVIGD